MELRVHAALPTTSGTAPWGCDSEQAVDWLRVWSWEMCHQILTFYTFIYLFIFGVRIWICCQWELESIECCSNKTIGRSVLQAERARFRNPRPCILLCAEPDLQVLRISAVSPKRKKIQALLWSLKGRWTVMWGRATGFPGDGGHHAEKPRASSCGTEGLKPQAASASCAGLTATRSAGCHSQGFWVRRSWENLHF